MSTDTTSAAAEDVHRLAQNLRDWAAETPVPTAILAAAGWLTDLVRERDEARQSAANAYDRELHTAAEELVTLRTERDTARQQLTAATDAHQRLRDGLIERDIVVSADPVHDALSVIDVLTPPAGVGLRATAERDTAWQQLATLRTKVAALADRVSSTGTPLGGVALSDLLRAALDDTNTTPGDA